MQNIYAQMQFCIKIEKKNIYNYIWSMRYLSLFLTSKIYKEATLLSIWYAQGLLKSYAYILPKWKREIFGVLIWWREARTILSKSWREIISGNLSMAWRFGGERDGHSTPLKKHVKSTNRREKTLKNPKKTAMKIIRLSRRIITNY